MITRLRKCTGSLPQFRYQAVTYVLLNNGLINKFDEHVNCNDSCTSIRRLQEHGNYEALVNCKWTRIREDEFAEILFRHGNRVRTRLRKKGSDQTKDKHTYKDVLSFEDHYHFMDRLKERFIENPKGIESVLNYVFSAGKVIDEPEVRGVIHPDFNEYTVLVYEKDLDMLIICDKLECGMLMPKTTFSPNNNNWFSWLLKQLVKSKKPINTLQTLQQYTKKVKAG